MKTPPRFLFPLAFLGLATALPAQNQVVDALIAPISLEFSGGNVIIVFEDQRPNTANTHFEAQHSENVTRWTGISGGEVVEDPATADRYTLTAPEPTGERIFYRVVRYSTTAEDSDGDGLSDAFETTLEPASNRTNPNRADSDDDGYSDGVEFAAGTLPNDPDSKPDLGELPQVEFAEASSPYGEGDFELQIPLMVTKGYSGPISYETLLIGSGTAAVSNTTQSSSGSASIAFSVTDDAVVEQKVRLYLITITNANLGVGYNPSGTITHSVVVSDNDAYWSGKLVVEAGEFKAAPGLLESTRDQPSDRDFRICVARSPGSVGIQFTSGNADGFYQPDGGNSSQSTGVIPDKNLAGGTQIIFDSETNIFTTERFEARTPQLPVATAGFLDKAPLQREIHLLADTKANPEKGEIQPGKIFGYFTDKVNHVPSPSGPTPTYLASEVRGFFVLVKAIPLPADIPSPLTP